MEKRSYLSAPCDALDNVRLACRSSARGFTRLVRAWSKGSRALLEEWDAKYRWPKLPSAAPFSYLLRIISRARSRNRPTATLSFDQRRIRRRST